MKSSNLLRVAFIALAVAIAACSSTPAKDTDKDKSAKDKPLTPANPFRADSADQLAAKERKLGAEGLYRQARLALDTSDFSTAISRYGQIAARFPFTEYATQADLERVYALYRSFQPDDALTAADKFLKEHPRHPAADYVQYIKGLVNTSRDEGLSGAFGLDNTKEDTSYLRRAFDDFSLLAQKYPTSPYAGDARQHMIDLRNRIAQHDLHIVHYYVKRGAFIAAAKRAEQILLQYPGAPVSVETMQILEKCYVQMGLTDQAADVHKLLVAQVAMPTPQTDYPIAPKKPGFFKSLFGSSKSTTAPAPAAYVVPAALVTSTPAETATPAAEAAPSSGNWLKQLFTPGNKPVEGAVIVLPSSAPSTSSKSATSADAPAAAAGTDATPANSNAVRGNGFSVTMEPYEEAESKKSADKPVAAKSAPVPAPTPAAPAAQDPAEAPTFSNWLRHLFSSDKKPAEVAPATTAAPAANKPADASTSTKPADENKTPTLMDLLYNSVAPEKKADDSAAPSASKPATTP
jgi:outer membrane protein assembly factor BamD